jgi:hypothetical protein
MEYTHVGNANWGQVLSHGVVVECDLLFMYGLWAVVSRRVFGTSECLNARGELTCMRSSSSQRPVTQWWLVYEGDAWSGSVVLVSADNLGPLSVPFGRHGP